MSYSAMCLVCGFKKEVDINLKENKSFLDQLEQAKKENKKLISKCVFCGNNMEWKI